MNDQEDLVGSHHHYIYKLECNVQYSMVMMTHSKVKPPSRKDMAILVWGQKLPPSKCNHVTFLFHVTRKEQYYVSRGYFLLWPFASSFSSMGYSVPWAVIWIVSPACSSSVLVNPLRGRLHVSWWGTWSAGYFKVQVSSYLNWYCQLSISTVWQLCVCVCACLHVWVVHVCVCISVLACL